MMREFLGRMFVQLGSGRRAGGDDLHPDRHRQAEQCRHPLRGCRVAYASGVLAEICVSCVRIAASAPSRRGAGRLWPGGWLRVARAAGRGLSSRQRRARRSVSAPRRRSPSPRRHGRRRTSVAQAPAGISGRAPGQPGTARPCRTTRPRSPGGRSTTRSRSDRPALRTAPTATHRAPPPPAGGKARPRHRPSACTAQMG